MKDGLFEAMLDAIVGFELEVTQLLGTSKLNQNKSDSARKNVIKALKDDPIATEMKKLV